MKLVVGLGNPGPRYAQSRHNVGFRVVERLALVRGLEFEEERFGGRYAEGSVSPAPERADGPAVRLGLLLPGTFMNRSGEAVAAALEEMPDLDPTRDLVVVYDDLDLPLGRLRVRPEGGAGGHRGLESVLESVGTRDFARVRFGIGRPAPPGETPAGRAPVVDFVLDAFTPAEQRVLAERIPAAADAVVTLLRDGVVVAMDRFNGAPEGPARDGA